MAFGKTSLYLPSAPTPAVDWERFRALPKAPPLATVPLLDVAAINRRLAPWRKDPTRILRGSFRVPVDISQEAYTKLRNEKIKAFIEAKEADGWQMVGWGDESRPVKVVPSKFPTSIEPDGSKGGQPGMREMVVAAKFRKTDFRPVRIDVADLVTT